MANNPTYSYRNVLLILHQNPNATKVMGFKAWLRQDRCVQQGQRGLRIIAKFEKDDEEDEKQQAPSKKKPAWKRDGKFRRISVFDISQTIPIDRDDAVEEAENPLIKPDPMELFQPMPLTGKVENFPLAIRILQEISPLPIRLQSGLGVDSTRSDGEILVCSGMSQLHTIRTIVNQIVREWRHETCSDKEQLEIEAESVAFIVCQYLGLDTSEYFLISQKRAQQLLQMGSPVYLVFPGEGELLTYDRKAIDQHEGPFATDRAVWFAADCRAA